MEKETLSVNSARGSGLTVFLPRNASQIRKIWFSRSTAVWHCNKSFRLKETTSIAKQRVICVPIVC